MSNSLLAGDGLVEQSNCKASNCKADPPQPIGVQRHPCLKEGFKGRHAHLGCFKAIDKSHDEGASNRPGVDAASAVETVVQEHEDDESDAQGVEEHQYGDRGDDDGL